MMTALALACVWGSGRMIEAAAAGKASDRVETVPKCKVGLVLGCVPMITENRPNLYFRHRIRAATELYFSGKIRYLLVSGDNHRQGYDEPASMKEALIASGVPADRIVCDYAGFRTLDSVVRAREVFGLDRAIVISQRFHNERAIYIGRARGLDLFGYNASDVTGTGGVKTHMRELAARVRTVLDVNLLGTAPHFPGPKEPPIGGD